MDAEIIEGASQMATEVVKDVYQDVAHPGLQSAGEVLGLVPRAVNAALVPLREWIEKREYRLASTKKLLEKKLEKVAPEEIVAPEIHIAVPALQAIGYSMDNEEIRDMYANLLASSMQKRVKNEVLPADTEFIKQLSPDEARILRYIYWLFGHKCGSDRGSGGSLFVRRCFAYADFSTESTWLQRPRQ